jgi:hypothetical protein
MLSFKTHQQPYQVIRHEKNFEIRFYPSVTMATVTSTARSYDALLQIGFKKLASYIFGGNEDKLQIAMTSPVHMDINESLSSMSFVMPEGYSQDDMPEPDDHLVSIQTTSDEYVAAIKFGGYADDSDIKLYSERLEKELKAKSISYYSNFRFLGYDRPYHLLGRKNEVIVSVTGVAATA